MTETEWSADQLESVLRLGLAEVGVDVSPGSPAHKAITKHVSPLREQDVEPRPVLRLIEGGPL